MLTAELIGQNPTKAVVVEVPLYYHYNEAMWSTGIDAREIVFKCIGAPFGKTRWRLHGAYPTEDLPEMTVYDRASLCRALTEMLRKATGAEIVQFNPNLVEGPWS